MQRFISWVTNGPEVLVAEGALEAGVAPVAVPGHHRHVLQVALAALVADRAVVGVAHHQQLDHLGAEAHGLGVVDGDARALLRLGHAGHDDLALLLAVAPGPVEAHRALPAGADRAHRRVPAEERQVEAQREGDVEQVASGLHAVLAAVDDRRSRARARRYALGAHAPLRVARPSRRRRAGRARPVACRAATRGTGRRPLLDVVARSRRGRGAARPRAAAWRPGRGRRSVLSEPMNHTCSASRSRSSSRPRPSSIAAQDARPSTADPRGTACTSRTTPGRRTAAG